MTHLHLPLWDLDPFPVSPAELALLTAAAQSSDATISDYTHRTKQRTARRLGDIGLMGFTDAVSGGWERGMWSATLNCLGWNTLWRGNGDRHIGGGIRPGMALSEDRKVICGGLWRADGTCESCTALRRLDLDAFEQYVAATDADERAFLTTKARLWCNEHGFARESQWTTDKTCRLEGSTTHERTFYRV